jgi:cystathionine beta-lyase
VLHLGWSVAPEDAYVMLRGLRTLPVRLERQAEGARRLAEWLGEQPQVAALYYPALPGDPDHRLWKRDFTGAASLFAFALQPGPEAAVNAFLDALKLFGLGFSWGGFESLAISCDPQLAARRFKRDYGGPLIRLHVGLEEPADLIADLAQALQVYDAAVR